MIAKRVIWRLESDRYALTMSSLHDLGRQLGNCYDGKDPERMGYRVIEKLRGVAWEKFAAMDMFFVKVCRPVAAYSTAARTLSPRLLTTERHIRRPTSCTPSQPSSIFET